MKSPIFAAALPLPPSVNRVWQIARNRMILTQEGRGYRTMVVDHLNRNNLKRQYDQLLGMSVCIYPPDRRRRDADNVLKSLLDALQAGGLYVNDSQIKHLDVTMREKMVAGGCVIVKLYEYAEQPEHELNDRLVSGFRTSFSCYPDV